MPQPLSPPTLHGMSPGEIEGLLSARQLPPVDLWNPPHCGHSAIRIARDGTWFHEGRPIERPKLVHLFARILRREPDGEHVLVTPVEKLTVDVDWTAFRAVSLTTDGAGKERRIAFTLDHADPVVLGPSNPLLVLQTQNGLSPRVAVRHGLEAELARRVYYELAELALAEDGAGIWSDGAYFALDAQE